MNAGLTSDRRRRYSPEVTRLFTFSLVGLLGFLVDGGLLTALAKFVEMNVYLARGVSFPMAVTITWYLNRRWTFSASPNLGVRSQYARYVMIQIMGAALSLAIFAVPIAVSPALADQPILPLGAAALLAAIFNYAACKRFAFRTLVPTQTSAWGMSPEAEI